ncbi:hypothetical protein GQ54DRAFT_296304 [Martensiomyces pterosporus]|nr:hypothetical protein GQ54DRAFT_296304 [Martensiomyces pterosporus]
MKLTAATLLLTATLASAETWKITSLDAGRRANLCALQIQTCQNNCGGPDQAPMAFCNETTLAWGCGCSTKTPDFALWNWPVPAADCEGSAGVCRNNCNSASGDRNTCFENCSATHKCNSEDAPISYTNSTDTSIPPSYTGPAVSYKGDKLGDLNDGNSNSSSPSATASGSKSPSSASKTQSSGATSKTGSASEAAATDSKSAAATTTSKNSAASLKAAGLAVFAAAAAGLAF